MFIHAPGVTKKSSVEQFQLMLMAAIDATNVKQGCSQVWPVPQRDEEGYVQS